MNNFILYITIFNFFRVNAYSQNDGIQEPPLVTVPYVKQPPVIKINGALSDAAWQSASGITGFFSFTQSTMVPADLQPRWLLCFDDKYLYLASTQVIYLAGTARAVLKRCDLGGTNTATSEPTGLLAEDHVEMTLSEFIDDRSRPLREYFYKWVVNPYAAVVDQRAELSVGWSRFEWESDAITKVLVQENISVLQMAIPWLSLGLEGSPKNRKAFLAQFVNAQDAEHCYFAWVPVSWKGVEFLGAIRLERTGPAAVTVTLEPRDFALIRYQ